MRNWWIELRKIAAAAIGVAALAVFCDSSQASETEIADPAFVQLSPEERIKAQRALKKVERRSKRLGIALNRGKMEKLKGARLVNVLKEYDRFISILEELPENFVKACKIDTVWFSDEIVDMSGSHAGGFASGEGINMAAGFARGTVYHEIFHKFERNISPAQAKEWEDLNPEDFIYEGSAWDVFAGNDKRSKKAAERYKRRLAAGKEKSAKEKRDEARSKKDAKRIAANKQNQEIQGAFINDYAQTTPNEDRAEVFRAMVEEGPRFLLRANANETMRKKMEFMIRLTGTDKYLGRGFWDLRVEPERLASETELGYGRIDTASWKHVPPEEMGFDSKRLELIPKLIKRAKMGTSAVMVVAGGKVIYEYGDTSTPSDVSACWTSLLAMCFGRYINAQTVDLNETLEEIGLSDVGGLLAREKKATVCDLLTCRSACFHPSGAKSAARYDIQRGSRIPGGEFYYNEWDFTAAASVLELKAEKSFIDLFSEDIAHALQFQDWSTDAQSRSRDVAISEHYSYTISLSARDMARVGYMMLRHGEWRGMQIVPRSWVSTITSTVSKFPGGGGFGYFWWIEKAPQQHDVMEGAFSARGHNAQRITVIPKLDMVIVHKAPLTRQGATRAADYRRLVQLIVTSKKD